MNNKVVCRGFVLTEDEILASIKEFLVDCDADDLARLVGEMFGGKCIYSPIYDVLSDSFIPPTTYLFEPDENYCGEFGEVKKHKNKKDYYFNLEYPFLITATSEKKARKKLQMILDDMDWEERQQCFEQDLWVLQKTEKGEDK